MGQAFDREGNVLGDEFGATKREVLDRLEQRFSDAHEVRIRTIEEQLGQAQQMPRYRCHKEVQAAKIEGLRDDSRDAQAEGRETDGSTLMLLESPLGAIRVKGDWMRKHNPHVGGYYVVYKDGYTSFSPAEAFTEGYTRI